MPTQWSGAEQVPLGCIAPHRAAVSFFSCLRRHSFLSAAKEKRKKRRQKLRFWISLRGFTWFLLCLFLPRERCAMQISSKYCIVSASLFAAAFALKCKAVQFYIWCVGAGFYAVERSGTSALGYPARRLTAAPLVTVCPNTAQRCHFRASDRRHWRGNPFFLSRHPAAKGRHLPLPLCGKGAI